MLRTDALFSKRISSKIFFSTFCFSTDKTNFQSLVAWLIDFQASESNLFPSLVSVPEILFKKHPLNVSSIVEFI
jgi:hypothetical protein